MRRAAAIVGLVSTIAAAPAARAGDELMSPTPQQSPTPPEGDFGWQVAAADVAGIATTIALIATTDSAASLLPYLLAAPAVHAVHRHGAGAVLSLALNAGLPPAGMFLGWAIDGHGCGGNSEGCGGLGMFFGLIVGVGAAVGLDAVLLAHPGSTTAPAPQTPKVDVAPSFAFAPDRRLSFGLSGRF